MLRSLFLSASWLVFASTAWAQYGVGVGAPYGPYFGVYPGPYYGYFPGAYQGFWSNGFSLYGPPVPTYGSIPGFFGGSDQRLSNFPDLNWGWYGPYGWRGGYVPLNAGAPRILVLPQPAICEIRLPADDAEVTINGERFDATGANRKYESTIVGSQTASLEIEARWANDRGIGAARRTVILRPGELVVADFTR